MADGLDVVIQWQLRTRAPLQTTWELLSDTDRFNRVAGLEYTYQEEALRDGTVRRQGSSSRLGVPLRWVEPPFDWQAPHRFGITRTFTTGPAESYSIRLELQESADGGTDLDYSLCVVARSTWTRPLVQAELATFTRPALERTLQRAVAVLDGTISTFLAPPPPLSPEGGEHMRAALAAVDDPQLQEAFERLLREESLDELRDLQPLRLARRWHAAPDAVVRAFLQAVRGGAFTLQWSLRCPSCRVGKGVVKALTIEAQTVHCASCNITFDGSLPDAMIAKFLPDRRIRELDEAIRCIGSPARTAHVRASAVLAPGAAQEFSLRLLPGSYRIRTLPAAGSASLQVRPDLQGSALALDLEDHGVEPPLLRAAPGTLVVSVRNRREQRCQLLVERLEDEPDVLTVGRLLELPEAAELLPADMIATGLTVDVQAGVVLAARIERGGAEAREALSKAIAGYDPEVLTARDGSVIAAFYSADHALEAASLVEGAPHVGGGLASGSILYVRESDRSLALGQAVERALALAQGGGALQVTSDDAGRAPLAASLARDGVVAEHDEGKTRVRIVAPLRSTPPLRDRPPAPPPPAGTVLGRRFRIRDPLGSGGFGAVYTADDLLQGGDAVVKLLHPTLAHDLAQLQRFYNEGRLAARVRSDGIARVLDYGIDGGGRVWLASERLHGEELARILREARSLDVWAAVALAADVARALADVHAAGLVHRDIKPGNVLVVQGDSERPRARLIDFGIAMAQGEALAVLRDETRIVGTPQYMAPEQAVGRMVDGRCDLFALGVLLFEALSGGLPFAGTTAVEMLYARIQRPPLSLREAGAPDVPPAVTALIEALLQREPADRPASATLVAQRLEDALVAMGTRGKWVQAWIEHRRGRALRPESGGIDLTAMTVPDSRSSSKR